MGTISARVPDELKEELDLYLQEEKLDRDTAVQKLLIEGLEDWRQGRALEKLETGEITVTRAAELAGVSVWDFVRLTAEQNVTWVGDDHLEADLEDR